MEPQDAFRSGQCAAQADLGDGWASANAPLLVQAAPTRRDLAAEWFYRKSPASIVTDVAQIVTSFVACGLFVAETYTGDKTGYAIAGYVVSAFCFADYCWRLFLAENKVRYVLSIYSVVDVLTILPSLLYAATRRRGYGFLRVVRLVQLIRIARFFRIMKNGEYTIRGNEVALMIAQDEEDVTRLQLLYTKAEGLAKEPSRKRRRSLMGLRGSTQYQFGLLPSLTDSAVPDIKAEAIRLPTVAHRSIEDALREEFSGGGHVLVCARSIANLRCFLENVRTSLEGDVPIVLLAEECPSDHEWAQVSFIPELYVVLGSVVVYSDMVRAGVQGARQVLLLSAPPPTAGRTDDDDIIADTDTVLTYYNIQTNCRQAADHVFVDLTSMSNAKFFRPSRLPERFVERYGLTYLPSYASGRLFSFSLFDCLLAHSFFNDYITAIVQKLLVSSPADGSSYLDQIALPEGPVRNYGELLDRLLLDGLLPLGLYRCTEAQGGIEPYVFTNPPKGTLLAAGDRVFVFRRHGDSPREQPLWKSASRQAVPPASHRTTPCLSSPARDVERAPSCHAPQLPPSSSNPCLSVRVVSD
eukprot:m51a1_g1106 putative calcium-activated potassium channel protein (582) ;mRNA; r:127803-131265